MLGGIETTKEAPKKCGLTQLLVFLTAVVCGTACSLCSKIMMQLHGIGIDGTEEVFQKPLFQTFGMFVGMCWGLVMHWMVIFFQLPFPGYDHNSSQPQVMGTILPTTKYGAINEKDPLVPKLPLQQKQINNNSQQTGTPAWMYWFLAVPSIFDLAATALCMMGLRYLDVSIYQLLRGSGIIFVALMKQHVFHDHLYKFQWVGVFWNVVSVVFVGATAILNSSENEDMEPGEALLGVLLVMAGAFVQGLQYVFEEKVMAMDESAVPPLLLIGMEGLWGTVLCLVVVYPLAYYLPGDDHGSYEDPFNTYEMFMNSKTIQWAFVIYFFAIFGYNMFAVLVTFMLSSVWHAILDNFRPITVWGTDLFIFYVITKAGDFGEPWTSYSWLQAVGMMILLYGTAIYNAPNAGSVKLQGEWFAFGLNLKEEYDALEVEMKEEEMDREWKARQQEFKTRRASSLAERPPYTSVHTAALRGLASPKL